MSEISDTPIPITDQRVGFGRRFAAILLDGVIILALSGMLYFIAGSAFHPLAERILTEQMPQMPTIAEDIDEEMDFVSNIATTSVVFSIVASIIAFFYSLSDIVFAGTPGKMMLGIKIFNHDATPALPGTLALRWVIKSGLSVLLSILYYLTTSSLLQTASTIVGIVVFIGCFFVLGSSRQALHDMIANTAVYRREVIHFAQA